MPEEQITPQTPVAVRSRSRPKRVAFLVSPQMTSDTELNQIFRYNLEVWGGRFNPLIPTTEVDIAEEWWKFLEIIDPDFIYAFLPLSDLLIRQINRRILPVKIVEVMPKDRTEVNQQHLIREYEIAALGVWEIPRYVWTTRGSMGDPFFFYIRDSTQQTANINFVLRNFGATFQTVFTDTAFRDVPHEVVEINQVSPSEVLAQLLPHGGQAVLPIDLCRMYVQPSYTLEYDQFTEGFHLVIGDDPLDVIYAWNRASLTLTHRGLPASGRNTFWLSSELCKDDNLLERLGQWIEQTFWASPNVTRGKVVSYSVEFAEIKRVTERMTQITHTSRLFLEPVKLLSDQFPCPDRNPIRPLQHQFVDQVPLSENKGLVSIPQTPFPVKGNPQAGWMVDLEIQYHPGRYSVYTNFRPHWQLPKRLGVAMSFFYHDGEPRGSRVVAGGLPSVEVASNDNTIRICIPSDFEIVWFCLLGRHSNTVRPRPLPPTRFTDLRVSDKGRYLRGLLQLFGNLYWAGNTFGDPFWRTIFLEMAGRPHDDFKRRTTQVREELNTLFEEDPSPLSPTSSRLDAVAERLANRLTLRGPEPKEVTREYLETRFYQLRGEALGAGLQNERWREDEKFGEWKENELKSSVENKQILQGTSLTCDHCGTSQWYVVDDLRTEMRCNGCLNQFALPVTPHWSFRLNGLVVNALRKHGTLAVLQALYTLERQWPMGMFLFFPCLDIYEGEPDNPSRPCSSSFTDIDLIVLKDGKFSIGEVKSHPMGFKNSDIEKLKAVAIDTVPDEVILAAPGDSWPPEVLIQFNMLGQALESVGTNVVPLLLR